MAHACNPLYFHLQDLGRHVQSYYACVPSHSRFSCRSNDCVQVARPPLAPGQDEVCVLGDCYTGSKLRGMGYVT